MQNANARLTNEITDLKIMVDNLNGHIKTTEEKLNKVNKAKQSAEERV